MEDDIRILVEEASMLIARLERLSADSTWARRASGCRGALLKMLADESFSGIERSRNLERVHFLMKAGYDLLNRAGREIPDADQVLLRSRPG